jgi:hypothetical protein
VKRPITLCLSLLLGVTALVSAAAKPAQTDDSIKIFWEKFRTAVIKGNKESVAAMSKFPVELSYGMTPVRNRAQLRRRWRAVFNEQSDAAKCFDKKQPEQDEQDPKRFRVVCPDVGGNEVIFYLFARTRAGWKFVGLDNINE